MGGLAQRMGDPWLLGGVHDWGDAAVGEGDMWVQLGFAGVFGGTGAGGKEVT